MVQLDNIVGIDPSFTGLGMTVINLEHKTLALKEFGTDLKGGSFSHIVEATDEMVKTAISSLPENTSLVGMEIPPTQGFYAVKLYALDTHLYRLLKENEIQTYLFGVPYLRYINGKSSKKEDTISTVIELMKIFSRHGFSFFQTNAEVMRLTEKKSKTLAYAEVNNQPYFGFTHNQADSFIYAVRMLVLFATCFPQVIVNTGLVDLIHDIVDYKPRFAIIKETLTGKSDKSVTPYHVFEEIYQIPVDYIKTNE